MKTLLIYITNDITICNNEDLEIEPVYLRVILQFSLICLLSHEYSLICKYDYFHVGPLDEGTCHTILQTI